RGPGGVLPHRHGSWGQVPRRRSGAFEPEGEFARAFARDVAQLRELRVGVARARPREADAGLAGSVLLEHRRGDATHIVVELPVVVSEALGAHVAKLRA